MGVEPGRRPRAPAAEPEPIPFGLVALTGATRMLAEARTLSEIRGIRDMAEAARAYAAAAGLGDEAIGHASAIKLDAERRLGAILAEMRTAGARSKGSPTSNTALPVLADLGVTRVQSSRWQALARLPEEEYAPLRERVQRRARGAESVPVGEVMRDAEDVALTRMLTDEQRRRAAFVAWLAELSDVAHRGGAILAGATPDERAAAVDPARIIINDAAGRPARMEVLR